MEQEKKERGNKMEFCNSVNVGIAKDGDVFVLLFYVDEVVYRFALTPQHYKKLCQCLNWNLQDFESKHGRIEAEWKIGNNKNGTVGTA